MIKIEISDVSWMHPDELLNLADYLKRSAEFNATKKHDIYPNDMNPTDTSPTPMTVSDFEREKEFQVPVPHDEFVSPPAPSDLSRYDQRLLLKPQEELIPVPPAPSQLFGKCSSIPESQEIIYPSEHNSTQRVYIPPSPDISRLRVQCNPEGAHIPPSPQVELDSNNLPWDSRIHARTKTKNKDGSWKGLRGVGPKVVDKVQEELKTVQEIPKPISIPLPPDAPVKDFAAMMTVITSGMNAKKIERIDVNKVLNKFGIPSIPVVATRPDLIPEIITALEEIINEPV